MPHACKHALPQSSLSTTLDRSVQGAEHQPHWKKATAQGLLRKRDFRESTNQPHNVSGEKESGRERNVADAVARERRFATSVFLPNESSPLVVTDS